MISIPIALHTFLINLTGNEACKLYFNLLKLLEALHDLLLRRMRAAYCKRMVARVMQNSTSLDPMV